MRAGVVVLALAFLTAGCARPPHVLRGSFAPLSPRDVQARGAVEERVRWGGKIVNTTPGKDQTCFEILSKPLDGAARPVDTDETYGRFVACAPGFYDPAVYAPGREVTVVGTVAEPMTRTVGDYEYKFPVVKAETVYLWRKREERMVYYDPWDDPFWGPYPFWGWGGGGFVAVPVPVCPPMRHRR
jgi:outer membrane lipoprotein